MYYLLSLILFIVVYSIFVRILGSIFKGCLMAIGIAFVVYAIQIMVSSTKNPVNVFGLYEVDNFSIRKTF